jgi:hypothetical protein
MKDDWWIPIVGIILLVLFIWLVSSLGNWAREKQNMDFPYEDYREVY